MPPHASFLDKIGIRGWYEVMCRLTGDKKMTVGAPPDRTLADLVELRQMSRYFAYANFWHGMVYIFPAIALVWVHAWFSAGLLCFVVCFNILCWQMEFYRTALAEELERRGQYLGADATALQDEYEVRPHWFYSPKKWESEKLYELIGFGRIASWVVAYTTKTKLKPSERASGEKAKFIGGKVQNLAIFERDTRIGEKIHLTVSALNIPPLIDFFSRGMGLWAGYLVLVLTMDVSLALLQRYHRIRVTRLIFRSRRRR